MIYIACALHCEARPLIEKYKLRLDRAASYPLFRAADMALVVSGIGRLAMASACAYAFARCGEQQNAAWLNIGIAGAPGLPAGSLLNINKVCQVEETQTWYPARIDNMPGEGIALVTHDAPQRDYSGQAAFDMEGSAFFQVAQRFSLVDLIQILKVVSDNAPEDIGQIDKQTVTEWIGARLDEIGGAIDLLQGKQAEFQQLYAPPPALSDFLAAWHFTEYQRAELAALLTKARSLNLSFGVHDFQHLDSGKAVLRNLRQGIQAAAMEIRFD